MMINDLQFLRLLSGFKPHSFYDPVPMAHYWPIPKGPTGIAKARRAAKKRRNAAKRGAA